MRYIALFFVVLVFLFFARTSSAESTYVLPYPSFMPGSIFYPLNRATEEIQKLWYFGSFGQFHYNLSLSDKYLVEAKTLFAYKQYLLGSSALSKSNDYFSKLSTNLRSARDEKKDIIEKETLYLSAAEKHSEELEKLKRELPESILWSPEKESSQEIMIHKDLRNAVEIRKISI